MIKELKLASYKMSKRSMLCCIVAGTMVLGNGVTAKAMDTSSATEAASSSDLNTSVNNNFLVDETVKTYYDINKVEKIAGFKFKVPDFLPAGSSNLKVLRVVKLSNSDNGVQIYFAEPKKHTLFSFQASKNDPIEILKLIEGSRVEQDKGIFDNSRIEIKEQAMNIGGINGKSVTLSYIAPAETMSDGYFRDAYEESSTYFVWQNEGLYYSIEYNSMYNDMGTVFTNFNFSEDVIDKIVKSIKYPEEAKVISYATPVRELAPETTDVMSIYDKEDLENAKKLLGFNPKLPLSIDKDINITNSRIGITRENTDIVNKIYNYYIKSTYSNKKGSISFEAGKYSRIYDNFANGNVEEEKLNISNKDVFKTEYKMVVEGQLHPITYRWKEDGIYYSITFSGENENSDEIVKSFVDSKPIV